MVLYDSRRGHGVEPKNDPENIGTPHALTSAAMAQHASPEHPLMHTSAFSFILAPLLGWLAVVSLLVVAYLGSLFVEEKRRNRHMNAERQRLGLSRG